MDHVDKIIAYESGELTKNETVEFFQELINNGMAWTLQGQYGRTASMLIEQGLCSPKHDVTKMSNEEINAEVKNLAKKIDQHQ